MKLWAMLFLTIDLNVGACIPVASAGAVGVHVGRDWVWSTGRANAAQSLCGGDRLPEERTAAAAGADAGANFTDGEGVAPIGVDLLQDELAPEGGRCDAGGLNAEAMDYVGYHARRPAAHEGYVLHWRPGASEVPGARGPDLAKYAVRCVSCQGG